MSVIEQSYTEDDYLKSRKAAGEADWVLERRREALASAGSLPFPTFSRTRVAPLRLDTIRPEPATAKPHLEKTVDLPTAAGHLVLRPDGRPDIALPEALSAKGVLMMGLDDAIREVPDKVKPFLFNRRDYRPQHQMSALHEAYFTGGYFIYVPKGTELEEPLAVTQYLAGSDLSHALIVVEDLCNVTFLETLFAADDEPARVNGALEIHVGDGSRVKFFGGQKLNGRSHLYRTRDAFIGRDTAFEWILGEIGAGYDLVTNTTYLLGQGGEAESIMVFVGDKKQHFNFETQMVHVGAHTRSNMDTKGILKDRARAAYLANTDIKRKAVGTRSWQSEKTLMLDPDARADLVPALWIDEADVVQAGHAATAGQVDQEQLYYLMSRGISKGEALFLLVFGFLDPILKRIPLEAVREDLLAEAGRKIRS